jgi:hypothetical protein
MSTQLISPLNYSSQFSFAKDLQNKIAIPKTARAKARGQK